MCVVIWYKLTFASVVVGRFLVFAVCVGVVTLPRIMRGLVAGHVDVFLIRWVFESRRYGIFCKPSQFSPRFNVRDKVWVADSFKILAEG